MSVRCVRWALEVAPVTDPTQALVLLVLCEHMNDDGRGAWPSVEVIAKWARCSPRTVQRHLAALRDRGLIAPIEEVKHHDFWRIPANYRPTVWAIAVPGLPLPGGLRGATDVTPADVKTSRGVTSDTSGVTPMTARGDTGDVLGVSPVSPKPEEEPQDNPKGEPEARERAEEPPAPPSNVIDLATASGSVAAFRAEREALHSRNRERAGARR